MAAGRTIRVLVVLAVGLALAGAPRVHGATTPSIVYFDQNEEQDVWTTDMAPYSGLPTRQLIPPWDPNGQMCILPDGSGRFTVGYNPTGVEQTVDGGSAQNPGARMPRKQPPVGVAIYNQDGSFSGHTMFVPGPYKLTSASSQWTKYGVVGPDAGGDIPPDSNNGPFNNEGTYTGCAFDKRASFFAVDIGTSQGNYPPFDNGRLIEWFAPDYTSSCIIYGPDSGGNTPPAPYHTHHVDGHGGLQQPGTMASDKDGNIYVPVDMADPTTLLPQGKILRFDESKLPATPADCPGSNGDQSTYHVVTPSTFIDATAAGLPFPQGIAWDPACGCWAVDNVFFGPTAVEWFDTSGSPLGQTVHLPIPANFGGQFSPEGIAFDAAGDLFVVDIHVQADPVGTITTGSLQVGPVNNQGRLLMFTFNGPVPNPPTEIASGENFPVAVVTCDPAGYPRCPGTQVAGAAATPAPAASPPAASVSGAAVAAPNTTAGTGHALPAALAAGAALAGALVGTRHRRRRRQPVAPSIP